MPSHSSTGPKYGQCPGSVHHVVAAVRAEPFDQRGDVVTGVEPNAQVDPDREDEHAAVRRRLPSGGRASERRIAAASRTRPTSASCHAAANATTTPWVGNPARTCGRR